MSVVENVIVVGSGPSGYTAAIYLARAGLNPIVLTSSVEAGGALVNTTEVENFPGFPDGIQGPELMENMRAQAERFGARIVYDDAVNVDLVSAVKTVRTGLGAEYSSHAVVLAMGSAYRKLEVPGEERLTGHGVSWCATCDGFFFRGKQVVVVGGGDSALEEAMFLTRFGTVTLLHRRDTLRASKIMQDRALATDGLTIRWNSEVVEAHGGTTLTGLTIRDTVTGVTDLVPTDGLFIAIGHDPRSGLVTDQVTCDDDGYVLVEHPTTHTNLRGVFAAGDLVDKRYRQAITAAGSGCAAASDAEHYLASHGLATYPQEVTATLDDTAQPV
jgi:thioredoxin reductase (NADPH)